MVKQAAIFIIEPERIIGLELQLELEKNGYSVFQSYAFKKPEEFKDKHKIQMIIVNIDKVNVTHFIEMKKEYCFSNVFVIGISSGTLAKKEYEGINLLATFSKPYDIKEIVFCVEKHLGKLKSSGNGGTPNLTDRKYFDMM